MLLKAFLTPYSHLTTLPLGNPQSIYDDKYLLAPFPQQVVEAGKVGNVLLRLPCIRPDALLTLLLPCDFVLFLLD